MNVVQHDGANLETMQLVNKRQRYERCRSQSVSVLGLLVCCFAAPWLVSQARAAKDVEILPVGVPELAVSFFIHNKLGKHIFSCRTQPCERPLGHHGGGGRPNVNPLDLHIYIYIYTERENNI